MHYIITTQAQLHAEIRHHVLAKNNLCVKNHPLMMDIRCCLFKHELRQLENFVFKHSACSEVIKLAEKLTLSSFSPYTHEFIKVCKYLQCAHFAE